MSEIIWIYGCMRSLKQYNIIANPSGYFHYKPTTTPVLKLSKNFNSLSKLLISTSNMSFIDVFLILIYYLLYSLTVVIFYLMNYNTRIKTSIYLYHSNTHSGHRLLKIKLLCHGMNCAFISSRNHVISCFCTCTAVHSYLLLHYWHYWLLLFLIVSLDVIILIDITETLVWTVFIILWSCLS